jgi:ABC-type Co2+ transport system permease subunit
MENPLLFTILITGSIVAIVKIFANIKLRKVGLTSKRYNIYKKMIRKPLGAIYFLILNIKA